MEVREEVIYVLFHFRTMARAGGEKNYHRRNSPLVVISDENSFHFYRRFMPRAGGANAAPSSPAKMGVEKWSL